ncbi:hypothetical protein SCUCBS95973_007810 [Sporothrix curviconia]|uniref:MFS maltose permease n=1 Tax=Sporothrix curviconia TaxID=1260050 RepID=A0ABP0CGF6_9PEZI
MRPRPTILHVWSRRLGADRLTQDAGRRAFSFTQRTTLASGGHSWSRNPRTRPQLPFLVVPSASAAAASRSPRYFTTQRRRWLRYEALAFVKYTLYFWAAVGCFVLVQFFMQQEAMERAHPTPHEWSFMSRMRLRGALTERGDDGSEEEQTASDGGDLDSSATATHLVNHVKVMQILLDLLKRLEDPKVDGGAGLAPAGDKSSVPGVVGVVEPSTDGVVGVSEALDIRAMSEPWRRGYYEALLAAAATAEHVDGWLLDRTRNTVFPPDIVLGPSNPNPRPLPPGATGAPREEDCEPVFPAPAEIYLKLLHTRGLTAKQQITAAMAFANYLEYKQDNDAAAYVYGKAVLAAREPLPEAGNDTSDDLSLAFFDRNVDVDASAWITSWSAQNHAANNSSNTASSSTDAVLSRNLLSTLTAYATFKARSGDIAGALPLFVSLLQARRSLPPSASAAAASAASARSKKASIPQQLLAIISPPSYPPPPDDGFSPPLPGARATCEEAALRLHIGEILYASARKATGATVASPTSPSASSWGLFSSTSQEQQAREEGIAWTREAVDIAEEQLHTLAQGGRQEKRQQKQALENGQGGITNAIGKAITSSTSTPAGSLDGSATCRQCLVAGLDNWAAMVAQLARDEERRAQGSAAASDGGDGNNNGGSSWWPNWLSFWGSSELPTAEAASFREEDGTPKKLGRWAAEEQVIQDRRRRARELMDDAAPPSRGFLGMLTV